MGRVKKKENKWRKIDTKEVDDFVEKTSREERQGILVDGIPDAELFFVDKEPGNADNSSKPAIPHKLYHRQRLTRAQVIVQGAHTAKPIATVPMKKKPSMSFKGKKSAHAAKKEGITLADASLAQEEYGARDLWATALVEGSKAIPPANKRIKIAASAVAVDAAGCSYNPDRELHQDAVAEAVAAEMRKIHDRDLQPSAPLRVVDYTPEDDELELLLEDAIEDDEEEDGVDGSGGEGEAAWCRGKQGLRKKNKTDRNREVRNREIEKGIETRRRVKQQRRDLSNLKLVQCQVEDILAAREERRRRRAADRAEKAISQPPKLGKHTFEPLPVQVLTTEELEESKGSLRQLKPTAMLAKERFKSLQRRGLIEPRRKVGKSRGKKIEYVHGQRADNAAQRQAEVETVRENARKGKKSRNK